MKKIFIKRLNQVVIDQNKLFMNVKICKSVFTRQREKNKKNKAKIKNVVTKMKNRNIKIKTYYKAKFGCVVDQNKL